MDDQDLRVLQKHLDNIENEVKAVKVKLDNDLAEVRHLLRHLIEIAETKRGLR